MITTRENRITLFGTRAIIWGTWIILLIYLNSILKEILLIFELRKDGIEPYFTIFLFILGFFIAHLWWKKYYKLEKNGGNYKLTRSFSFSFSDKKMPTHIFLLIIYIIWIALLGVWFSILELFYVLIGSFYNQFHLLIGHEHFDPLAIFLAGIISFIMIVNFTKSIRKRFFELSFWVKTGFIILLFFSLIAKIPLS